ncbi:MAG: flagellar biosynthesis protein FliQ [Deltaproteobacteria bacterium]|nr:flagellar biosynthesis protein FliQ [Deltaproteobacteria bacterium]
MTHEFVVSIGRQAIELTLMLSAPMLGFGLVVGLLVSLFQAVTQIQEMTLTFIPKILAVMLAMVLFMPWMLRVMLSFTAKVLTEIPQYLQ